MKLIVIGTLLIIVGGVPLFVGADKSFRATTGASLPEFHSSLLDWIVTWMPTLSDPRPETCLNNIAYLIALGFVLLGGYLIAKAIY